MESEGYYRIHKCRYLSLTEPALSSPYLHNPLPKDQS